MRALCVALGAIVGLSTACAPLGSGEPDPAACVPDCTAGPCADDGCGATCGPCDAAAEDACLPTCSPQTCALDDGCGGTCGPCASAQSCASCVLRLSAVDELPLAAGVSEVTLALDYAPPAGVSLPALADLRLLVTGPAHVEAVGLGPAATAADKELFTDPKTGRPFRLLPAPEGAAGQVVQVLVFSPTSMVPMDGGRVLALKVRVGDASPSDPPPGSVPATFQIVEREQTFAPPEADTILWGGGYGAPVVIWPEVDDVQP